MTIEPVAARLRPGVRLMWRAGTCQSAGVQFARARRRSPLYGQRAESKKLKHKTCREREQKGKKPFTSVRVIIPRGGLIGLLIIHNSAESGQLPAMMN